MCAWRVKKENVRKAILCVRSVKRKVGSVTKTIGETIASLIPKGSPWTYNNDGTWTYVDDTGVQHIIEEPHDDYHYF